MRILIARRAPLWRQVPLAVLLLAAQVVVGLLVLVLRTGRAVMTLAVATSGHLEYRLAARTGQPVLSDTGIAAICAAFFAEFHNGYHQTTGRTS